MAFFFKRFDLIKRGYVEQDREGMDPNMFGFQSMVMCVWTGNVATTQEEL